MDAREDVIRACATAGQALVENGHRASGEVSSSLETLERESGALQALWEQRRVLYLQCMDLQLFYRDTEQADAWMHKQEVGRGCHVIRPPTCWDDVSAEKARLFVIMRNSI